LYGAPCSGAFVCAWYLRRVHRGISPDYVFGLPFPIFFGAMWIAISFTLSAIGGWGALASSYATRGRPRGTSFRLRSARVGLVGYNNCLRFVASPAGLFMAVLLPFRLAHPPLFAPWSEISVTPYRGWVFRYVDFRFARHPNVRLRLFHSLAEEILRAGGRPAAFADP
jgi:hypothetical protein